jgi:hypothetical protein
LSVVDRFPPGVPGDQFRRGVCEAIEASTAWVRRERLRRLRDAIDDMQLVQRRNSSAGAVTHDGIETLLGALRAALLPLVQDRLDHEARA